jgi:hypothetical protein
MGYLNFVALEMPTEAEARAERLPAIEASAEWKFGSIGKVVS